MIKYAFNVFINLRYRLCVECSLTEFYEQSYKYCKLRIIFKHYVRFFRGHYSSEKNESMKTIFCFLETIFIGIALLLSSFCAHSQSMKETVVVDWGNPLTLNYGDDEIKMPSINGQLTNGFTPNYFFKNIVSNAIGGVEIASVETILAPNLDKSYLEKYHIVVNESIDLDAKVTNALGEWVAMVNLMPYILKKGQVHRIVSFDVVFKKGGGPQVKPLQKDFVASSVLGNGEWYKISIPKDGFYKIERDLLISLGVNVDNINPQHINVYGNGDGLLPQLNSAPRTDDLAKNAITIVGESDGSFDAGDFIVFFGWGPHRWYASGTSDFYQERHVYSDVSTYFINVNPSEPPLRVASVANSTDPITNTVSSYSDYRVYEQDYLNLVGGGSRWYGELFDEGPGLTRTFSFSVPNIDPTAPANFEVSIGSNVNTNNGTAQKYSINGNLLYESLLPAGTEFGRSTVSFDMTNPTSVMPLQIEVVRNAPDVLTYLDKITLNMRRELVFFSSDMQFRDLSSVGTGNVAEYQIQSVPATGYVWEVTNRHGPQLIAGTNTNGTYTFVANADSLRTYAVSNGINYLEPTAIGRVANQNLHALPQADYLIVTHPNFVTSAERLANLHRD